MLFLAILLLAASLFTLSWATSMIEAYWDIMTIPTKIVSYAIPIGIWAITCIVWCNVLL